MKKNSPRDSFSLEKARESQSIIDFSIEDVLKININLHANKAQGHDTPSIKMIKICNESICKHLQLIFEFGLKNGQFPNDWKNAYVVPVHNKKLMYKC